MAVSLTRFPWWIWSGKEKDSVSNGSSLNSSTTDWSSGLRELDSVKFTTKNLASARKVKRKWHSREERRVDKQYGDAVVVPSDGGICLSGSESDGPDWSIGWVEPHGLEFRSDDETDDGFAVLVPCYRPGCKELVENSNNQLLSAIKNLPNEFSSEGKNYMEWLSSLQNF
ncbi:conserved hypothetical protein [Ricinus communis]|uniref:Uncharacterized protein n=1 Tax=Ricinus communis TaxID=3988 RepID=B9T9K4_RICCO|nr:conserved hypothetical protein [Ricinus communis]|eukprot:XP_002534923.1 uncharacterized protein LOC8272919 [Ricinus communis]